MKRLSALLLIIIFSFTGCSTAFQGNANILKQPNNNSLLIKGTWEVAGKSDIDNKVTFDLDNAYLDGQRYNNVHYKLKIVKSDYTISYEHNVVLSDFVDKNKDTDVYSILSEDKLICELFLITDDSAIVSYKQEIFLIEKKSETVEYESNKVDPNKDYEIDNEMDNSTGFMLALKSKNGKEKTYRTLWIPYYDKKLGAIYELPGITFPRKDGIYKIESKSKQVNGFTVDEFKLMTPDKKVISYPIESAMNNRYRDITFLSNDYIGIAEVTGEEQSLENTNLKVLPVKNLNSTYGVTIQELYGNYAGDDYKNSIIDSATEMSIDINDIEKIDYTNYTLYRESGKWNLYSKVDIENKDEVIKLSLKPNPRLVNYDTLIIPWKNLKAEFPLMKDVFISPIQDIAVIMLDDSLGIYEIRDGGIVSRPLFNIPIDKNEEVIMAEWCSGFYVPFWETSFLNGKVINK